MSDFLQLFDADLAFRPGLFVGPLGGARSAPLSFLPHLHPHPKHLPNNKQDQDGPEGAVGG